MKFLKSKRGRLIATVITAILVVSTVLVGTFALDSKPVKEVRLVQPNDYTTIAKGTTYTASVVNINTAFSTNEDLAKATPSGTAVPLTAKLVIDATAGSTGAGELRVAKATKGGTASFSDFHIINPNGIAGYDLPNGGNGFTMKKSGSISDELAKIKYYKLDAPNGTSENVIASGNYKSFTPAAGTVTWTSLNEEIVDNSMNIVANGTTVLFGKFTDRWGTSQTIVYLFGVGVAPGSSDSAMNNLIKAIEDGEKVLADAAQPGNEDKYSADLLADLAQAIQDGGTALANTESASYDDDCQKAADDINSILNELGVTFDSNGNPIVGGVGQVVQGKDGNWYIKTGAKDGSDDVYLLLDSGGTVTIPLEYYKNIDSDPPTRVYPDGEGGWSTTDPGDHTCLGNIVKGDDGKYYIGTGEKDGTQDVYLLMDADGYNVKMPLEYYTGIPSNPKQVWPDGNGGWSDTDPGTSATVTSVVVSPDTTNVEKGSTQQFTAAVAGTNSPAQTVTWTVNSTAGSTISASGLLTVHASETATTLTVTATSTIDNTKTGTATVKVSTPITDGMGTVVSGRTVTTDAGTFIEIARNGDYSLIVRTTVIQKSAFRSSGNSYSGSTAQNIINEWFYGGFSASSSFRNYVVTSDVMSKLGTWASMSAANNYSVPTGTVAVRTYDDTDTANRNAAFLLSFGEAAQYCSKTWYNGSSNSTSNVEAIANWNALADETSFYSWLRSPGGSTNDASVLYGGGGVDGDYVANSSGLRPALWVQSSIFD